MRDHRHDLAAWRAERTAPPCEGWRDAFGWEEPLDKTGVEAEAWSLLKQLLAFEPDQRPSAAEALLGHYLNINCAEGEVPVPAARPWTLDALVGRGATIYADDCAVDFDE